MKNRLRFLAVLMSAVLMLFGLAACGSEEPAAVESIGSVAVSAEVAEEASSQPASSPPSEAPPKEEAETPETVAASEDLLDPDSAYTTKEDVALYLYTYGELPSNFITKKEAQALGWSGGSLEPYAPGKCIGGDRFGNYEGLLPEDRTYHECDINTLGAESRGAERLVFSDDGLIYYTGDHYKSFTLLYGEE